MGLAATDYFGGDPYPGIFDGIFTIATNFADHLPWRRVLPQFRYFRMSPICAQLIYLHARQISSFPIQWTVRMCNLFGHDG